ncbi:MAG: cadherin repeat domain-containing protein [Marinagarivorans sp.]
MKINPLTSILAPLSIAIMAILAGCQPPSDESLEPMLRFNNLQASVDVNESVADTKEDTTVLNYLPEITQKGLSDRISYSISGVDAEFFAVDAATGAVRFKAPVDFEQPKDANHDNRYDISITATAGAHISTQSININVKDVKLPTIEWLYPQPYSNLGSGNSGVYEVALKIYDKDTNQPIPNATLYLNGSKMEQNQDATHVWNARFTMMAEEFEVNVVAEWGSQKASRSVAFYNKKDRVSFTSMCVLANSHIYAHDYAHQRVVDIDLLNNYSWSTYIEDPYLRNNLGLIACDYTTSQAFNNPSNTLVSIHDSAKGPAFKIAGNVQNMEAMSDLVLDPVSNKPSILAVGRFSATGVSAFQVISIDEQSGFAGEFNPYKATWEQIAPYISRTAPSASRLLLPEGDIKLAVNDIAYDDIRKKMILTERTYIDGVAKTHILGYVLPTGDKYLDVWIDGYTSNFVADTERGLFYFASDVLSYDKQKINTMNDSGVISELGYTKNLYNHMSNITQIRLDPAHQDLYILSSVSGAIFKLQLDSAHVEPIFE